MICLKYDVFTKFVFSVRKCKVVYPAQSSSDEVSSWLAFAGSFVSLLIMENVHCCVAEHFLWNTETKHRSLWLIIELSPEEAGMLRMWCSAVYTYSAADILPQSRSTEATTCVVSVYCVLQNLSLSNQMLLSSFPISESCSHHSGLRPHSQHCCRQCLCLYYACGPLWRSPDLVTQIGRD